MTDQDNKLFEAIHSLNDVENYRHSKSILIHNSQRVMELRDSKGRPLIFHAVSMNLKKMIRHYIACKILNSSNVDVTCERGNTALMVAARKGHADLTWELLKLGACIEIKAKKNAKENAKENAIIHASKGGHTMCLMHILLYLRCIRFRDPAQPSDQRQTPIAPANTDEMGETRSKVFDENKRWTALMYAVKSGSIGSVNLLLEAGDLNLLINKGPNIIDFTDSECLQKVLINARIKAKNLLYKSSQNIQEIIINYLNSADRQVLCASGLTPHVPYECIGPTSINAFIAQTQSPLITHVDLSHNCRITTRDGHRFRYITCLQKLNLSHCFGITSDVIQYLEGLPILSHIDLSFCEFKEEGSVGVRALANLKSLKELRLCGCKLKSAHLQTIQNLSHLVLLDVSFNSIDGITHLTNLKHLRYLNVTGQFDWVGKPGGPFLSASDVNDIARGIFGDRRREYLKIVYPVALSLEGLDSLNLTQLLLSYNRLNNDGKNTLNRALNEMKRLECLHMNNVESERMTNEQSVGLPSLLSLTTLKRLTLSIDSTQTGESEIQFDLLPILEELHLDIVPGGGTSPIITNHPSLKILSISRMNGYETRGFCNNKGLFPKLHHLDLDKLPDLNIEELTGITGKLASRCESLQTVRLNSQGFNYYYKPCQSKSWTITKFQITPSNENTLKFIPIAATRQLMNLRSLELPNCNCDLILLYLRQMSRPQLTRLDLYQSTYGFRFLNDTLRCVPNLQYLNLSRKPPITLDTGILLTIEWRIFQNLKHLELENCYVTTFQGLEALVNLKHLNLAGVLRDVFVRPIDYDYSNVQEIDLLPWIDERISARQQDFTSPDLEGDDKGLRSAVKSLTNLTHLDCSRWTLRLSPDIEKWIGGLQNLQTLNLAQSWFVNSFTIQQVHDLMKNNSLTSLTHLNIARCNFIRPSDIVNLPVHLHIQGLNEAVSSKITYTSDYLNRIVAYPPHQIWVKKSWQHSKR